MQNAEMSTLAASIRSKSKAKLPKAALQRFDHLTSLVYQQKDCLIMNSSHISHTSNILCHNSIDLSKAITLRTVGLLVQSQFIQDIFQRKGFQY